MFINIVIVLKVKILFVWIICENWEYFFYCIILFVLVLFCFYCERYFEFEYFRLKWFVRKEIYVFYDVYYLRYRRCSIYVILIFKVLWECCKCLC